MNAEYYRLLKEFIAFKTISGKSEFKQECKNCASWLENLLLQNNFKVKNIIKYGAPILVANYMTSPGAENVVIYGNYDVSAANKKDGWKEDPYSLYLWKDQIIWRGVAEWKWQLLLQILSVFKLIQENTLKYNVTFLIEWERLSGSTGLKSFLQETLFLQEDGLNAQFLLASIGTFVDNGPVVNSSFRWNIDVLLWLKTANRELWTDSLGGIAPNPACEWAKLISKLYDINNQINIPYFYYEVEDISANEKTINWRVPFDKEQIMEEYDVKYMKLDDSMDIYSKRWWKPCLEITSFNAWNSEFQNHSIVSDVKITMNMKLVPNQKTQVIQWLFEEWIKWNISNYVDYQLDYSWLADAVKINLQNQFVESAEWILQSIYWKKILQISSGFSFPIAKYIQEKITKNILNIPMVNDNCNLNSHSENFDIELIEKWFNFVCDLLKK